MPIKKPVTLNPALAGMSDGALEAELASRKLQQQTPRPIASPDWSKLKHYVTDTVEEVSSPAGGVRDFKQYVFEEVMEALYGKDFWNWWNNGPCNRAE